MICEMNRGVRVMLFLYHHPIPSKNEILDDSWKISFRNFTCAVLGGLSFFSLGHFFPPTPSSTTQISTISIFGGAFAGLIGLCWGWYCAEDFANEAVSKLLELLFLGAAVLIIGGVTFLIKAL